MEKKNTQVCLDCNHAFDVLEFYKQVCGVCGAKYELVNWPTELELDQIEARQRILEWNEKVRGLSRRKKW